MKSTVLFLIALFIQLGSNSLMAKECILPVYLKPVENTDKTLSSYHNSADARLSNSVRNTGITLGANPSQFHLEYSFSDVIKDRTIDAPTRYTLHCTLNLKLVNNFDGSIIGYSSFELHGVGTTEQKSWVNALSIINSGNKKLSDFWGGCKDKILQFYDSYLNSIMVNAERAAAQEDFAKAIYLCMQIPACSTQSEHVSKMISGYYQKYIDRETIQLLTAAKGIWASNPKSESVPDVWKYLMEISPYASNYAEVEEFAKSIMSICEATIELPDLPEADTENMEIEAMAEKIGTEYGKKILSDK